MDDATTEYTDLRLKLSAFLRSSRHYTPEQLLSNPAFNVEDMPEERAILLSRIGQHAKALTIYVHKMGEDGEQLAEEYCRDNYDPAVEMHRDVQNLHIDMLRQFELQQRHLVGALEQFTSRFASLVAENEALRNENEVLRNID